MPSAIIIDDEAPARNIIKSYLEKFDEIEIKAECSNGFEGLKSIQEHDPDIIFLDIQMPKVTGFEMLELLDELPVVIFSTAYDEYAIKAFDMNAVDYLLKPYSEERFDRAVKKALERLRESDPGTPEKEVLESHVESSGTLERIVVKSGNKIKVISTEQVDYIEAYDDYVYIHTNDARFIKQQTMGFFENHLDEKEFARVHRSYIVRLSNIIQIEPYGKDSKVLLLKSGNKIKVSRSGLKVLKEKLGI
jgi:two-component system LytT family response regulator